MSSNPNDLRAAIAAAEAHAELAHKSKMNATSMMERAMRALLPDGSIIDQRTRRGLPHYLVIVWTSAGRDHGTRIFRICSPVCVELDPLRPELSTWSADAIPISEKTGRDLNGRAGHALSQRGNAVRINGQLSVDVDPDEPEPPHARLTRMLEMLQAALAEEPEPTCSTK